MTQQLTIAPLRVPGSFGLNTEQEGGLNDARWALTLQNARFDGAGRAAARKGYRPVTTAGAHSDMTEVVFEYVEDATSSQIISAAGLKLYSGTTTLTDVTGTITTPTANNWQFVNYNGAVWGVQSGHPTISKTGGGNFSDVPDGTKAIPEGNAALSAWGRFWMVDDDQLTIHFTDILSNNFDGAGAGVINTLQVWPDGIDRIQAISEFQNRLLIFGVRSILVYTGADVDPGSTLALEDVIVNGVAENGRDTVHDVGTDIIYVSNDGLRSLTRGVQFSTLPLTEVSSQVKTKLISEIDRATGFKAAYSPEERGYFLRIERSTGVFYWFFDLLNVLETGDLRASEWMGIGYHGLFSTLEGDLLLGTLGEVSLYDGFTDDGSSYEFAYFSAWLDLDSAREKILKTAQMVVLAQGNIAITLKWKIDFAEDIFTSQSVSIGASSPSEWGIAEWGLAEWSGQVASTRTLRFPLFEAGQRIQIGYSIVVNGNDVAVQQIDLYAKQGRVAA